MKGKKPTFNPTNVQKDATAITRKANASWYKKLDFTDEAEKENALRGLIEAPTGFVIRGEDGHIIWDVAGYDFLKQFKKAPDSVNPSLWRNTLFNSYAGLFEVCDGIYQVRGYDMSNATFIRTDHGWIVFDVLMCEEDMAEAKALMEKHFGSLHIVAVLYSHSHVDHYGGIFGLIKKEDAADETLSLQEQFASGKVVVIAPDGFLEHAVSENIYAGGAMARRAQYQYGVHLHPGPKGRMALGIGLEQSVGNIGLLPPTYVVKTNETIKIDGIEVQFQLTPGTEAPAEMHAYFPDYRALWLAENCTGTMHNLYTLRGAQVRNASDWAKYILEAEDLFGDKTDVVFQSHNWPHWGTETIKKYMEDTAAVYKYINDQTLHYANLGYTPVEIARMLELPEKLGKVWYIRQYYGTLNHNIKAVYQRYLGWYDANPVNLNLLTPEATAKKWVEYFGDVNAVLEKARKDYAKGEYQWVAQVTKELVFADPANQEARNLCADALEQLGYQAESGTWRSSYLTAALELRCGNQAINAVVAETADLKEGMTAEMMLDFIDIATDAGKAQNDDFTLTLNISDTGETFFVKRTEGVLLVHKDAKNKKTDCTLTCSRMQLLGLMSGRKEVMKLITAEGDATVPVRLVKYMTPFKSDFNIVEP
ncbi:MAG: MBL fold metallo-hydrolase [Acidaminococcaceae bacterium]|nr:MBL fold metallo-hydrolase [Acidaminococcaceae bacterium]